MKKAKFCLKCLNLSRVLAHHLIGENHTNKHRKAFGIIIMLFGISIVKTATFIHLPFLEFVLETFGTGVHGIGLIPFISGMEKTL